MSAFAVIYERSNIPVDPAMLENVLERLTHRGPDGRDVTIADQVAIGHWHFWTTPEEVGEKQPLKLEGLPFKLVLDGRLDNRPELFEKLRINPAEGCYLSDAALILHSYAAWGERCLEHFIGEYALVIFDESRHQLLCGRDALGERTLFYSWLGTCLVVASEPWAVVAANKHSSELNENMLPYYFGWKPPEDGRTFFKNVYEVLPAHGLLITDSGTRIWRHWQPDLVKKLRNQTDQEYADKFRMLLEESVRCRMRSTTPVGVELSGGLDSGSVACLAASLLAPEPLTTISYVFKELTDCDERIYIETIEEQWGIRSIQITGDNFWACKDFQDWLPSPNEPHGTPLFLLAEQVYQRAKQEGLRVLLTGGAGDHLYSAGVNWLTDLLREGRWREAWQNLFIQMREKGWRRTLATGFLQRAARDFINTLPGGRHLRRPWTAPVWLTPQAREALRKQEEQSASFLKGQPGMLGINVANGYSHANFFANYYNVELRHPYRDRRLVEFAISLPALQLYNHGVYKHILRNATRGILPELIRTRRDKTSANAFLLHGIEREQTMLQASIQDPESAWVKYINPKWLMEYWNKRRTSSNSLREYFVLWLCVTYQAWHQTFILKNNSLQ